MCDIVVVAVAELGGDVPEATDDSVERILLMWCEEATVGEDFELVVMRKVRSDWPPECSPVVVGEFGCADSYARYGNATCHSAICVSGADIEVRSETLAGYVSTMWTCAEGDGCHKATVAGDAGYSLLGSCIGVSGDFEWMSVLELGVVVLRQAAAGGRVKFWCGVL